MKRSKADFWMAHIAEIKREGISTSAYAKRHQLSLKSLYGWQRKFNAGASTATAPSRSSFIALHVAAPAGSQSSGACTLFVGSHVRLEMTMLPSPQWLAALGHAAQGTM